MDCPFSKLFVLKIQCHQMAKEALTWGSMEVLHGEFPCVVKAQGTGHTRHQKSITAYPSYSYHVCHTWERPRLQGHLKETDCFNLEF